MLPVITLGCAGAVPIVTDNVRAALAPQELLAVTEIVPPFAPTVVFMLLVVEVPDQPLGNVHV